MSRIRKSKITNNSKKETNQNTQENNSKKETNENIHEIYDNTHENNSRKETNENIHEIYENLREKLKMITKTFEPKEMVPFGQLRKLNQKELLKSLEDNEKLGIVIKDQLKVAMMDMEKYQIMVDAVQEYERLIEWLDEHELFEKTANRWNSNRWEELPEGVSLMEWAGIIPKG